MNCIFFGHRDAPCSIKGALKKTILSLLDEGVECFYVGNNGQFDFFAQVVLKEISAQRDIKYAIVLSRINESAIGGEQEKTLFCEGMESALPRFAVSKRNEWLVKNASVVVAYVTNPYSNSHAWVEKARKRGAKIINLYEK